MDARVVDADGSSTSHARSHPPLTPMPKVAKLGDGAWLRQRYVIEGASISAIAAELGCAIASVRSALAAEAISVRASGPRRKLIGLQADESVLWFASTGSPGRRGASR